MVPHVAVLPLQLLHDVAQLPECLEGLFGFLNGKLGVLLLLPLGALVHGQDGTGVCGEGRKRKESQVTHTEHCPQTKAAGWCKYTMCYLLFFPDDTHTFKPNRIPLCFSFAASNDWNSFQKKTLKVDFILVSDYKRPSEGNSEEPFVNIFHDVISLSGPHSHVCCCSTCLMCAVVHGWHSSGRLVNENLNSPRTALIFGVYVLDRKRV